MKLKGQIEAVSSVSSGFSQYTGNPWKSCSLVLVCAETVQGQEVKNRFLLHCKDEVCDCVQQIVKESIDQNGEINGTYECTCFSHVRDVQTRDGRSFRSQDFNCFKVERV